LATKYTVLDFAKDILQDSKKPLLYQEIWDIGKNTQYVIKLGLTGKTPWQSLGARLFIDVRDNPDSLFIKVGKNPARFFLKSKKDELSPNILNELQKEEIKVIKKNDFMERDLHPLMAYFAYTNIDFNKGKAIYTKTIFHEKSKKSGLNEWIHPDMIGFYIPIEDWNQSLLEFNNISESNSIKLYSFEIKRKIDKSNYRAYFFQTVSNSSWANEGYLVAADIKKDDDLYAELERLSTSFDIGVILLDLEDIDSSKVLFSAKEKVALDWELMNKLCEQNKDFESFVDDVTKDYKVKTIHSHQYDNILSDPAHYIGKLLKKK